jgi:hypothetical protein
MPKIKVRGQGVVRRADGSAGEPVAIETEIEVASEAEATAIINELQKLGGVEHPLIAQRSQT